MNFLSDLAIRARPRREWIEGFLKLAAVVAIGIVLGFQYVHPDKRVLAVLVATIVFGIAWRLDMIAAIGVLLLTLPYPRGTVFGNTNLALILFLLVMWLLRVSMRQVAPPRRTAADVPIIGLVICYIVSFYNIRTLDDFGTAFENMVLLTACLAMFYIIVNNVRTANDLRRFHLFQVVSIATVSLIGLYELNHPDAVLIPGWIYFRGVSHSEGIHLHGTRIGGPFFDYELMAEYCALNLLLLLFLLVRARPLALRVIYGALATVLTINLFATVTRGALVALVVGVVYLAWRLRRRIRFVPLTVMTACLLAGAQLVNYLVAKFSPAGNLITRLVGTQFVGLVPESRVGAWSGAVERLMVHPLIGWGPTYSTEKGLATWFWPHCLYLFVPNLIGLIGLAFFLAMLARFWIMSRPAGDNLRDPDYARAFLIIAHVQLLVFLVDQIKIEYLRNGIYLFQVWLLFASIVAAYNIARASAARRLPAPETGEAPRPRIRAAG